MVTTQSAYEWLRERIAPPTGPPDAPPRERDARVEIDRLRGEIENIVGTSAASHPRRALDEGVSLLFLHISRGKKSVVLDLRTDTGRDAFLALVRDADAVVEAMRPGGLERRGLGFEQLKRVNPRIVFCTISGYGMTGPYRDMPSHGIAYDVWAGIIGPKINDDGFAYMPEHVSI